jgi:hypothetical protein
MTLPAPRIARQYPTNDTFADGKDYAFKKDYLPDFVIKGYKITTRKVNGKEFVFLQRFEDGKLVEELPYIEREIDLYVTGIYRMKSGKNKGRELVVKVRIPMKISYAPKKEYMDSIRIDVEDEARQKFDDWSDKNGLDAITWSNINVEMKEK